MITDSFRKAFLPVLYIFLALTAVFLLLMKFAPGSVDFRVLLWGNLLLFAVSVFSVNMSSKALTHKSTQGFLRLVYGSFILKFFALAIAAFIYIAVFKKDINKPGLFGCFGLYFIYTFIEIRAVLNQSKKSNA